jgi:hypothetical protein
MLANIYLHYTFDLRADQWRRHLAREPGDLQFDHLPAGVVRVGKAHLIAHRWERHTFADSRESAPTPIRIVPMRVGYSGLVEKSCAGHTAS